MPPESCLNDKRVKIYDLFDWHRDKSPINDGGEISQRGFGRYTLCARCNSNTGSWYGHDFVQWSLGRFPMWAGVGETATGVRFTAQQIYPLRILKQVVSMMLSVGGSDIAQMHPEFAQFLLNRESHALPDGIKIGTFLFRGDIERHVGPTGMANFETGVRRTVCEITGRPMGYTMLLSGTPLESQCYIEDWSRFGYNEVGDMTLTVPVHMGDSPYPGIYRNFRK